MSSLKIILLVQKILIVMASIQASAQNIHTLGNVSESTGKIWVQRQGEERRTKQPDRIFKDDKVISGWRGTATLKDGGLWWWGVRNRTQVDLHWTPAGNITIHRLSGIFGNSNGGEKRKVHTEAGFIETYGTSFYAEVTDNGTTLLYVFDGSVALSGRVGGRIVVGPDRAAFVAIGNVPQRFGSPPAALVARAYYLATATSALVGLSEGAPDSNYAAIRDRRNVADALRNSLSVDINSPFGQGKGE